MEIDHADEKKQCSDDDNDDAAMNTDQHPSRGLASYKDERNNHQTTNASPQPKDTPEEPCHSYNEGDDSYEDNDSSNAEGDDQHSSSIAVMAAQRSAAPGALIAVPGPMDVICGRGKSVAHPGNLRFRQLILARKQAYQQAKRRDDKTRITFEIVEELRRGPQPSRFLLKDARSLMWQDVGDEYAREKVSHALRSRPHEERRKQRSKQQHNSSNPNNNSGNNSSNNNSAGNGKPKSRGSHSTVRQKSDATPQLEDTVHNLIREQQQLLRSMIEKEAIPTVETFFIS